MRAVIIFLLCAASVSAQYARKDGVVQLPTGQAVAGASIAVCSQPASAIVTPCTPQVPLYSTSTGLLPGGGTSQLTGNLAISDVNGNYFYYVLPGTYTEQIYGPLIFGSFVRTDQTIGVSLASSVTAQNLVGPGTISGTYTHSGPEIFTGPLNSNNLALGNVANEPAISDAIVFVSQNGNDANTGHSFGKALADLPAAYTALPSTGGWVVVGCGTFSFSSGISFATNGKPIKLVGSGPCTIFQYTGSSGTAILLDTGGGNPSNPSLLQDFNLITAVSGSTATGLQVGSTNTAKGTTISRIRIGGFQTLANTNAFGVYWEYIDFNGCSTAAGTTALLVSPTQDDNLFIGGQMSGCATTVNYTGAVNGPIRFSGTEFFAVAANSTVINSAQSNILHCVQCHLVFESSATNSSFLVGATNTHVDFVNSVWEDDTTTSSFTSLAQLSGTSTLNMTDTYVTGGGSTITGEMLAISGSAQFNWTNSFLNGFVGAGASTIYTPGYTGGSINVNGQTLPGGASLQTSSTISNGAQNVSGCSLTAATGGQSAGKFASGTTGTCTVTITLPTAPHGWTCDAHDTTTVADVINQTGFTTTSGTISGTTTSGDVITWKCTGF